MSARGYHAHIYFDARDASRALELRGRIATRFSVTVGTLHRQPVGPHGKAMFQVLIPSSELGTVLLWLMQNRGELSVLVHADTGDDYQDHTRHLVWLGAAVPLDLSVFESVGARSSETS